MTTIAAIAGLAIGTAISILFAPKSGAETRALLSRSLGLSKQSYADDKDLSANHSIEDIRERNFEHANHLQGPEKKRRNASLIKVPSAGTDAWKENEIKEQKPAWLSRDRI